MGPRCNAPLLPGGATNYTLPCHGLAPTTWSLSGSSVAECDLKDISAGRRLQVTRQEAGAPKLGESTTLHPLSLNTNSS